MTRRPLVSVLVPTYNGERYLDAALSCLQEQTYRNLEVLIRDDGSTDATAEIAARYTDTDPRFHYVVAPSNSGSTGNMIELLKLASGEYIKVLNQDDLLAPRCIERLLQPMLRDPAIVLSSSRRRLIDANGDVLPDTMFSEPLAETDSRMDGRDLIRHVIRSVNNQIGEPSTVLFRNGLIEPEETFTIDGVTYLVNNDIALWFKLLMHGDAYYRVAPLSSFRLHDEQRSADVHEFVTGTCEWPHLIEAAVRRGVIRPGLEVEMVVRLHALWLGAMPERLAPLPTEERAHEEARTAACIEHLLRLMALTPADLQSGRQSDLQGIAG
ncbi:Glycosyl transferase family 2 [Frankineae bacterium MT45]|nr:Glycosyl transferase family 2 [Frankineae bacterium MT45]